MQNNDNTIQEVPVTLTIKSNVNYPVPINILGNVFNALDTTNATTQYRYDLTSFSITTETQLSLQYKPVGASSYSVFTTTIFGTTLQDVVNALNTLGIGYFSLYTQSGSTYITTYNDNYVFGQLNIFDNTFAYVYYSVSQPNAGGSGLISSISGFITYTSPYTIGTTQYFTNVSGLTISVSGTTQGVVNTDVIITETNLQTLQTTTIFSTNYAPLSLFSTSFVAQLGNQYLIQIK